MQLNELIDAAAAQAGGYRPLARETGIPDSTLHNYRAGSKTCPPAHRALLAAFIGANAVEALIDATVERQPEHMRARVARALGKALAVVLTTASAVSGVGAGTAAGDGQAPMLNKSTRRRLSGTVQAISVA